MDFNFYSYPYCISTIEKMAVKLIFLFTPKIIFCNSVINLPCEYLKVIKIVYKLIPSMGLISLLWKNTSVMYLLCISNVMCLKVSLYIYCLTFRTRWFIVRWNYSILINDKIWNPKEVGNNLAQGSLLLLLFFNWWSVLLRPMLSDLSDSD